VRAKKIKKGRNTWEYLRPPVDHPVHVHEQPTKVTQSNKAHAATLSMVTPLRPTMRCNSRSS